MDKKGGQYFRPTKTFSGSTNKIVGAFAFFCVFCFGKGSFMGMD